MSNPIIVRSLVTALVNAKVYNAHSIIGKVEGYLIQSKVQGFYPIIENDITTNYMFAIYHPKENTFSFSRPSQKTIDKSEAAFNKKEQVKSRKVIQSKYRSFIMAKAFINLYWRYSDIAAEQDNAFASYRYNQTANVYMDYFKTVCRLLNWDADLLASKMIKRYKRG